MWNVCIRRGAHVKLAQWNDSLEKCIIKTQNHKGVSKLSFVHPGNGAL